MVKNEFSAALLALRARHFAAICKQLGDAGARPTVAT